jgi:hypothetical protein
VEVLSIDEIRRMHATHLDPMVEPRWLISRCTEICHTAADLFDAVVAYFFEDG